MRPLPSDIQWCRFPGSDLKSSLTYPNGLTASWSYGNRGELLEVNSASPTGTISRYAYTYAAAGRRVACAKSGSAFDSPDTNSYLYNSRSELTNATAAVDSAYRYGYDFDDIGNRRSSLECGVQSAEYEANSLNQYKAVDDFTPQYDADGNQTLVKTATGIWSVTYNGENRPIRWTQGTNTISMSFDRMGRRVTKGDQRFVYDGYLQIANYHSPTPTLNSNFFIWDPTEPIATRPLAWTTPTTNHESPITNFYTHDGNKNVSEVIASDTDIAAHYEYAPFGAVILQRGVSAAANPWRFSSEYADDELGCVYYNYRHYEPVTGRWMQRDPLEESGGVNLYVIAKQFNRFDHLGLKECVVMKVDIDQSGWVLKSYNFGNKDALDGFVMVDEIHTEWELTAKVECCCWQWNWGWGTKSHRIKNTITKSVKKELLLAVDQQCVGYTPVGVSSLPSPTSGFGRD